MPNAPAMPAPARKKDLLFNECIPYPLEESHNFTKKRLPCPKEACNESSRSLTRPHRRYLPPKSRARWILAHRDVPRRAPHGQDLGIVMSDLSPHSASPSLNLCGPAL